MREITELVRLCRLDSGLADELKEMYYLQAGLRKSRTTHQIVMGVLWLRDRLLQSCEGESSSIVFKKMDDEFSTLKKVVGLPKHAPPRGAGIQPVALASRSGLGRFPDGHASRVRFYFPPVGAPPSPPFQGQALYNRQSYGGPPGGSYGGGRGSEVDGAPGHYGSGWNRGRGGGTGRGGGRGRGGRG